MGAPAQAQDVDSMAPAVTGVTTWWLTRMADEVNRRVDTALMGSGLSAAGWRVVDFLGAAGPQTMTSLAQAASINGATLTRLIDRLVAGALVYRSADARDRRRVLVHLSARGGRLLEELAPLVLAAEAGATEALSVEERQELLRLLQRIGPEPSGR